MILSAGLTLLLASALPGIEPPDGWTTMQVTVRQRITVIRVPRMPMPTRLPMSTAPALAPIVWVEKSAERCVPIQTLAGAQISRPDAVDLVLTGGKRLRARLDDDCPALDFYRGFYVKPNKDGMICADRDVIRSRSGSECRIDGFRRLVPKR